MPGRSSSAVGALYVMGKSMAVKYPQLPWVGEVVRQRAVRKQDLDRSAVTSLGAGSAPTVLHDPGSPRSWH